MPTTYRRKGRSTLRDLKHLFAFETLASPVHIKIGTYQKPSEQAREQYFITKKVNRHGDKAGLHRHNIKKQTTRGQQDLDRTSVERDPQIQTQTDTRKQRQAQVKRKIGTKTRVHTFLAQCC